MSPIPDFTDNYHLADGEHICTIEEVRNRFLSTPERNQVWNHFRRLMERLVSLKLYPEALLIDGSFVTGREKPGDVDAAILLPPATVTQALKIADEHDQRAIAMIIQNQNIIRDLFGTHLLIFPDETGLQLSSNLFRKGKDGQLRSPDPDRDPDWVVRPTSKGILRIDGGEIRNAF